MINTHKKVKARKLVPDKDFRFERYLLNYEVRINNRTIGV